MSKPREIADRLGPSWIPVIYRERVRQLRTRSYSLDVPEKENAAEIMHTLLGIELKVGKIRLSCPDLAAARYIRVFARIGCRKFAIPYDITYISTLADELETAWHKTILEIGNTAVAAERSARRLRSAVVSLIRNEIREIGAGQAMPAFDQSTKQRP